LGALLLLFCTVNLEEKYLMLIEILFDIHLSFNCNCILLQHCCLLLSNKIDNKSKILFFFLYCNSTVLYILFLLSQLMTVYPFEHTLSLQTALRKSHVSRKSSHQWVILNDRYSTVWIAVHDLKHVHCSSCISVFKETTMLFKVLFYFSSILSADLAYRKDIWLYTSTILYCKTFKYVNKIKK